MKTQAFLRRALLPACILTLAMNPVQAQEKAEINETARTIARQLGFANADIDKVESGKVLTQRLRKEDEKELAVVLFALLPAPASRVIASFKANEALDADKTILDWGSVEGPASAASFAKLRLPADELAKLAGDDVGENFNLSSEEQKLLADRKASAASAADRKKAAMEAYREILATRVRAYQSGGLAGVLPYQHGRKQSLPRKDLEAALPAPDGVIATKAPGFDRFLREYPNGETDALVGNQFVWLLQVLNGRPAVVLAHRAQSASDEIQFFLQRDFYVGHTFDALQVLSGVIPAGEKESVILYTNATYTEQVTGFGSGAAHGIGRKIMQGEILTLFESVRAEF